MNYFTDCEEWRYLFRQAIDWDTIIPLYYPEFPTSDGFKDKEELLAFYEDLLTTTGKWAAETLYPRAAELDRVGGGTLENGSVRFSEPLKKTLQEAQEMDLLGIGVASEFGGMGLPVGVGLSIFAQTVRACLSSGTQLGFHACISDMIERFCDKDIQEKYVPMIRRGEISGSMCLTEPGAGSDVGLLRTSATKRPDGKYLLNGTKCFITNGGGGLGFVLARVKGAPTGLDGISMFFTEEWVDLPGGEKKHNYRISKIEDKMGMSGSTTCEVIYEDTIGTLVGKENEGFKIMLYLMNEARISVGLQGIGGIETALTLARQYAEQRTQFGKPIIELPLMKRNFQDWETERDAIRAMMVDTVSHFDIFQRLHMKKQHAGELNEKEENLYKKASRIVRKRTPLVKYYPSECYVTLSQKAVLVFGGYGFTKDYDIERVHRDSFGTIIYEGTSQIQALMAMKDFVKNMIRNPGKFVQSIVASHPLTSLMGGSEFEKSINNVNYEFRKQVASLMIHCFRPELSISEKGFKETLGQMNHFFKRQYWEEAGRFDRVMTHAETLCQALSYIETLKVLSKHASKDAKRSDLYYRYLKLVRPRLDAIYSDWNY